MAFLFLNGWKELKEEEYIVMHENYVKFNFNVHKVLLEHGKSICLLTVYGCFHTTIAESSRCERDHKAPKA